jgi:HD-GYP domain-containing protein (c-di-GMP phosphodiesterase class II)
MAGHPRIWRKPAPLSVDEWEQVRLHPHHTERVLRRFRDATVKVAQAICRVRPGSGGGRR